MTTVKEVFALLVTADGRAAVAELGRVGGTAEKELGRGAEGAKRMNRELLAMSAGVAAAGATTLAVLKSTADSYVQNGREVIKLQRTTGLAADEASKLTFAASQSGVGVDRLSTAFVRLSRSAGTEGGAKALQALGVNLKDARGQARPVADVFADVADQVSRLESGQNKNNLVTALFGRGGTELLPLLNKGRSGIAELGDQAARLGLAFTDDDLRRVKEQVQATKDLEAARAGLANTIGREVTPFLNAADTKVAQITTAAIERLASLPDGVKQLLAGGAVVGGVGASALGAVGTAATALNEGAAAAGRIRTALAAGTISAGGLAVGAGAAAAAAVSWGYTVSEVADQYERAKKEALATLEGQNLLAAFDPNNKNALRVSAAVTAGELLDPSTSPQSFWERAQSLIPGAWDESDKADVAARNLAAGIELLGTKLAALPETNAREYLDNVRTVIRAAGPDGKEALAALSELYRQLDDRAAAERAIAGLSGVSTSIDRVGTSAEAAGRKIVGTRAGIETLLDIADASKRLADEQTAQSKAIASNSTQVLSAYEGVIRAQQRLNDLYADQADLLGQIDPEEGIRRARARLAEANAILANDPRNADALTRKDEALADIESESRRRQEIRKTERDRARAIRDAQQGVTDARRSYDDAVTSNQDLASSASDAINAQYQLEDATNALVIALANGTVSSDQMRSKLQELYDKGLITAQAFADLSARIEDATNKAAFFAAVDAQRIANASSTKIGEHVNTYRIGPGLSAVDFGRGPYGGPGGMYGNPGGASFGFGIPQRSNGGEVRANDLYRIHPGEVFEPRVPGRVLTPMQQRTRQPLRTSSAPAARSGVVIEVNGAATPAETADKVAARLRAHAYLFPGVNA